MAEFIDLVHPETNGTFRTTEDAFNVTWKDLGWQKATEDQVAAAEKKAERAAAKREA